MSEKALKSRETLVRNSQISVKIELKGVKALTPLFLPTLLNLAFRKTKYSSFTAVMYLRLQALNEQSISLALCNQVTQFILPQKTRVCTQCII